MSATTYRSYTAKLTDGPLEGTTIRTEFTAQGEPQPRMTIPTDTPSKQLLYIRGTGVEFGDDSDRLSAVDYRFVQAIFEDR